MGVDEARAQYPVEMLNIIATIGNIYYFQDQPAFIGHQYRIAIEETIPVENATGGEFSVQDDWLIYCKFAAGLQALNLMHKGMRYKGVTQQCSIKLPPPETK